MSKQIPHPIPDEALNQHLAILGKTGSGKSFLTRVVVERLLDAGRRVCILDYTGVWYGLRSSADGKRAAYPIVIFGGEHADVPLNEHAGPSVAKLVAGGNRPCIIDLDGMTVGAQQRFVTAFLEELYRLNSDPLHLVIEEADEFAPQTGAPGAERMIGAVCRIFQRGRRKGFRAIAITQRPANLHKRVLTQCNAIVALRLVAPQDRKALAEWIRGHADDVTGREVTDSLPKLARGEGWVWVPEQDILSRTKFPGIKTFDSMRAPEDGEDHEPASWAEVDLDAIKDEMADAVREAVENDPKALKAEVAKLRRDLAAKGPAIDPKAIEAAERRGWDQAWAAIREFAVAAEVASRNLRSDADALRKLIESVVAYESVGVKPTLKLVSAVLPTSKPYDTPFGGPHKVVDGVGVPLDDGGEKLPNRQQQILDVLAECEVLGLLPIAKDTLAFLSEASPTSSSYGNNLGALRSAGLIQYPQPGMVTYTAEGRARAKPADRPSSLADLHDSVRRKLVAPQAKILDCVIENYPNSLPKTELAELVGASATSSSYGNNLGRLRSLGLIDYPEPGRVQATETMFPKGLR